MHQVYTNSSRLCKLYLLAEGNDGVQAKAIAPRKGSLLRIGHHFGADSVTVDAPRVIKIMKGRDQAAGWAKEATTLWLAAESKEQQMENMQPLAGFSCSEKIYKI